MDRLGIVRFRRALAAALLALLLGFAIVASIVGQVQAAQMNSRSLSISSAITSATAVGYTFSFKLGTTGQVQGLKFQFCTTALGTCTAPTGLTVASRTFGSQTGWTGGVNFAVSTTNTNDCDGTSTSIVCLNRTDATSENTTAVKTVVVNGITNPSGASCVSSNPNCTFFARMTTYTTNTFTAVSIVDTGTVAQSTVQTLTISATILEVLSFCIGSTAVNDADTTTPGADCSNIGGTSVNLGTLDSGNVNTSPVSTNCTASDCNKNGIAMLRSNASTGTVINYRAIQAGTGSQHLGTLRVSGATCNAGTINTDQCINAAGTTQTAFSAGTEKFGMTIGGVNCMSTTSYTCNYGTNGNSHLLPDAQYDGSGFTSGSANTYGTGQGFAWDESGTFDQIANSTGTNSAVDDEALILRFAATPNIVTPTGSYTVQADFIAIGTY